MNDGWAQKKLVEETKPEPSKKQILNSCMLFEVNDRPHFLHIWEKLNGSEWG